MPLVTAPSYGRPCHTGKAMRQAARVERRESCSVLAGTGGAVGSGALDPVRRTGGGGHGGPSPSRLTHSEWRVGGQRRPLRSTNGGGRTSTSGPPSFRRRLAAKPPLSSDAGDQPHSTAAVAWSVACPLSPTSLRIAAPSPSSATPTRARPPSPRSSCCTAGRCRRPVRSRPAVSARRARSDWMELEQKRGISITSAVLQFPYRRRRAQPARHARPPRLLRGHLPRARRRRRRRHGARRGQGHRGADAQAVRGLPGAQRPAAHVREQVGPTGPRRPRAARRDREAARPAAGARHVAGGLRRRLPGPDRPAHRRLRPLRAHRPRHGRGRRRGRRRRPGRRRGGRRLEGGRPTRWRCSTSWPARSTIELFLAGEQSPVFVGSAITNFGVGLLLDGIVDLAPPPSPRLDVDGAARKIDDPFSAFVFKVQANMDRVAPRPGGVRAGVLGPVRARHGRHPRAHRPAVRHQVRPLGVRAGARDARRGVPRRHRGARQRHRRARGRHAVRRRTRSSSPACPSSRPSTS